MNCKQINTALNDMKGSKAKYIGCYLATDIYRIMKQIRDRPIMFIINTLGRDSKEVMGHWIAVYKSKRKIVILDSYGINVYSPYISEFLNYYKDCDVYTFTERLQSLNTYVCGLYAMFFCYHLSNKDLKTAIKLFETSFTYGEYMQNDRNVMRLSYALFKNMPSCYETLCYDKSDICWKMCLETTG